MKNKLMIFALLAMCLCFGAQAWAANMLSNGDFDSSVVGNMCGWSDPIGDASPWVNNGCDHWINADTTDGIDRFLGVYGLKIWTSVASMQQDVAGVIPGTIYTIECVAFSPSHTAPFGNDICINRDGQISVEWYDGDPAAAGSIIGTRIAVDITNFDGSDPDDTWILIGGTEIAPVGAAYARVLLEVIDTGAAPAGAVTFDEVVMESGTDPTKATGGSPDEGFAHPSLTTELTWINPIAVPALTEVYFVESATLLDPNDAKAALDAAELLTPYDSCTNACTSTSVTLTESKYYAWRVVCDSVASDDWSFNTINTAPNVSAGPDQNAWLVSGTVDVDLDSTSADVDNLPVSATLTYDWTQTAGTAVTIADVEDPTVTLAAAGTYTFQLEVSDGLDSNTDEVTISVYAEADDRLVAHWKFEDDLLATVGTGIDGTETGTNPVAYVNGIAADGGPAGKALSLDGTNYVEILSSIADPNILHYDDEISVSAWIRGNGVSFGPQWAGVVTKGDSSWRIAIDGGGSSAEFASGLYGNEDFAGISGTQAINDGSWHYVVGVYDGAQIKIYIDGAIDNAEAVSYPIAKNDFGVVIGANDEEVGRAIVADIDEVRIFDKGLSTARVLAMYAADGGGNACGQDYAVSDLNEDCRTDVSDLKLLTAEWLDCTDLTGVNCN